MDYLINNWPLVVATIAVLIVAIVSVLNFFQKPTEEQIAALKEWLLFAVTEAEKALGSGTGKLKLRYVYDMFLDKFPFLSKFISFEDFSKYVDEALEEMKKLLESNEKVKKYVETATKTKIG